MSANRITVFGGTGFLGRYVVQTLLEAGYAVQVVARRASKCRHLKPLAAKGQLALRDGDVTKPKSIQGCMRGSFAVVNLIGILYEKGGQRFSAIHAQMPERLAQMAVIDGATHFVHLSALGVDQAAQSAYARSKHTGEKAVHNAFPDAVILRPSIVFGAEDNFFNQFAKMATLSPFLPLIGGGNTKFQPLYAGDVARAVLAAIQTPEAKGKVFELGGKDVRSFRELIEYTLHHSQQQAHMVRCLGLLHRLLAHLASLCLYLRSRVIKSRC